MTNYLVEQSRGNGENLTTVWSAVHLSRAGAESEYSELKREAEVGDYIAITERREPEVAGGIYHVQVIASCLVRAPRPKAVVVPHVPALSGMTPLGLPLIVGSKPIDKSAPCPNNPRTVEARPSVNDSDYGRLVAAHENTFRGGAGDR